MVVVFLCALTRVILSSRTNMDDEIKALLCFLVVAGLFSVIIFYSWLSTPLG